MRFLDQTLKRYLEAGLLSQGCSKPGSPRMIRRGCDASPGDRHHQTVIPSLSRTVPSHDLQTYNSTFDLFEKFCGMRRICECSTPERGDLIPYLLKGNDTPLLSNGVHVVSMGEDGLSGSVVKHLALLGSLRSMSCGIKRALRTLLIENARYLDKTPESLLDERVISRLIDRNACQKSCGNMES